MLYTQPNYSITSSVSRVTASAAVTTIEANQQRQMIIIAPSGSSTAFVLYGNNTPSATNCSYVVFDSFILKESDYKGPISIKFASSTGSLNITDCLYS